MKRYDGLIAAAAVTLSLILHGLLLFNSGSVAGNRDQTTPQPSQTRVSFRSVAAPQTPPQPPQPLPEQPPEPEITETPEPPPEHEPVKAPAPAPRAEKAVQPEPVETQPQHEPTPVPSPPTPATERAEKAPESVPVKGTVADPALVEQAKQEYLRRLMAHIEAYKHYPRAARRRGLEGDVTISFVLHETGRVSTVTAEGAHRLLLTAASEAVNAAQPMPEPPASQALPWEIAFTMRFTLR